jgi:predicted GNAT family N-acyltransferase
MLGDGKQVIGYHTLSATDVNVASLPPALTKKLSRYPVLPAVLMGRVAMDTRYRGRGLGGMLLLDAFRRTLRSEVAIFAFVVDPKDNAAESFYCRYRFIRLPDYPRRMFLPMEEVAKFFD